MKNKVAYMGVFLALALILSYVESLIPFYFGIPGVKLGLANLIVVIMLYAVGAKEAFAISMLRILLSGFLFGNLFSILYSFAGGILSFLVMWLVKRTGKFHVMSVSICGGITHNIGQILVASVIVETYSIFYYIPVLLIAGLITGMLIGVIAGEVSDRLRPDWFR
ncbi:MAG: Gx transporter family protein [Lachnospiraceae bacterium]|nr:Gx transporter family protein [Lachnospiraceae bacterium]